MKKEFITAKGKIIIQNQIIFIRTLYWVPGYNFWLRLVLPMLIVIFFFLLLLENEQDPEWYIRLIFWGFLALMQLPLIYSELFRKSYSNRIPLKNIKYHEVIPDRIGLQTEVRLYLKSGRYRNIIFRTHEKQFELFLEALPQSSTQQYI